MAVYKAPTRDTRFVINEVLKLEGYGNLPGFDSATADIVDAVVEEGGKFASEVLAPLNAVGDAQGCTRHPDGTVTTPEGFKQAFEQFRASGWGTLSAPVEFGGQGLPVTLSQVVTEMMCSANMAFSMYGGLTQGATAALLVHGSDEQKQMFVPNMVAGKWTGTMNLTEPQCGTDLGLLRTKAVKQADGSWSLTANSKNWPNATYAVVARATDAAGNVGSSASITLVIKN